MKGSLETCAVSAILLVAFAFTLCQSQMCQLNAAPHPQGVCGDRLTVAHNSLCFLLRRAYPHYFQTKRSNSLYRTFKQHPRMARDISDLERIYSLPVSALADVRLTEDNWRAFIDNVMGSKRPMQGESTGEFLYSDEALEELPKFNPTKSLLRMLSKRSIAGKDTIGSIDDKRSLADKRSFAEKRNGLVCECCMNVCPTSQMATYC